MAAPSAGPTRRGYRDAYRGLPDEMIELIFENLYVLPKHDNPINVARLVRAAARLRDPYPGYPGRHANNQPTPPRNTPRPNRETLMSLCRVNKKFKAIARPILYRTFDTIYYTDSAPLLLRTCLVDAHAAALFLHLGISTQRHPGSVSFPPNANDEALPPLLQYLIWSEPRIEIENPLLDEGWDEPYDGGMVALSSICSNIETLELQCGERFDFTRLGQGLRTLCFGGGFKRVKTVLMCDELSTSPEDGWHWRQFNNFGFFVALPCIRHLELGEVQGSRQDYPVDTLDKPRDEWDFNPRNELRHLSNLTSLVLKDVYITDELLRRVLRGCTLLEDLFVYTHNSGKANRSDEMSPIGDRLTFENVAPLLSAETRKLRRFAWETIQYQYHGVGYGEYYDDWGTFTGITNNTTITDLALPWWAFRTEDDPDNLDAGFDDEDELVADDSEHWSTLNVPGLLPTSLEQLRFTQTPYHGRQKADTRQLYVRTLVNIVSDPRMGNIHTISLGEWAKPHPRSKKLQEAGTVLGELQDLINLGWDVEIGKPPHFKSEMNVEYDVVLTKKVEVETQAGDEMEGVEMEE